MEPIQPSPSAPPLPAAPTGWNPASALAFQQQQDAEHIRLLAIFHYVVGSMMLLFACFPIIHLVIGLTMLFHPQGFGNGQPMFGNHGPPFLHPQGFGNGQPMPGNHRLPFPLELIGGLFVAMASIFILSGWTLGALTIYSGRCLKQRRRRTFSLVIAGLDCLFMPFGTALGVFTLITLLRPSVQTLFDGGGATPTAGGAEH